MTEKSNLIPNGQKLCWVLSDSFNHIIAYSRYVKTSFWIFFGKKTFSHTLFKPFFKVFFLTLNIFYHLFFCLSRSIFRLSEWCQSQLSFQSSIWKSKQWTLSLLLIISSCVLSMLPNWYKRWTFTSIKSFLIYILIYKVDIFS